MNSIQYRTALRFLNDAERMIKFEYAEKLFADGKDLQYIAKCLKLTEREVYNLLESDISEKFDRYKTTIEYLIFTIKCINEVEVNDYLLDKTGWPMGSSSRDKLASLATFAELLGYRVERRRDPHDGKIKRWITI